MNIGGWGPLFLLHCPRVALTTLATCPVSNIDSNTTWLPEIYEYNLIIMWCYLTHCHTLIIQKQQKNMHKYCTTRQGWPFLSSRNVTVAWLRWDWHIHNVSSSIQITGHCMVLIYCINELFWPVAHYLTGLECCPTPHLSLTRRLTWYIPMSLKN